MKSLFFFLILLFTLPVSAQNNFALNRPRNLSDNDLLELVQKQTFRYFWDFGHPVSGMARERSNVTAAYGNETVTTGGTGFGVMAMIVAAERQWITRDEAAQRVRKIVNFLWKADMFHGVFPHWLNGETGKVIRFSLKDDGGDLVETSFLFQGLLCAKQYFTQQNAAESEIRDKITQLWEGIEWNWHTRDNQNVLYWHWSPNNGWSMNLQIRGWNECLITYVLAASSPKYSIDASVYHEGWTSSKHFRNDRQFYNYKLPLGVDYGGPLSFSHYSFLGLNPRGLKDRYADYWQQNLKHTLINRAYVIDNPKKFRGYSEDSWGLTASDSYKNNADYATHSPSPLEDLGVISPTAALSAFPYTPAYSMAALQYFYNVLGNQIWSQYGFVDAFSEHHNWYARSHLAIDQGPIIVMIENYRTGLLWKLFMSSPDVQRGLSKLDFTYSTGQYTDSTGQ